MNKITIELPEIVNYAAADYETAERLTSALLHNYANDLGTTSLPYWMDQFSTHNEANKMIIRLAREGWITTAIPKPNWATLEINVTKLEETYNREELVSLIKETKLTKYGPKNTTQARLKGALDVKLPSGIRKTGIIRMGFSKASNHKFSYDTTTLRTFRDLIAKVTTKSFKLTEIKLNRSLRSEDGIDYASITELVIDTVIGDPYAEYTLGKLVNDSRGRAIFNCIREVFNPISNKLARSLVVTPPTAIDSDALNSAYLFIAELTAGFEADIKKKARLGKKAYKNRTFLNLNLNKSKDLDSLFENIWLSRVYADLDAYYIDNNHQSTTPLEVDFSASNLTIMGILLGHKQYINPNEYMWKVEGLSKLHVKFAQTPYVFGSSASVQSLWKKNKLTWTDEQVAIMRKAQLVGKFSIANEFKDIIIKHSQPEARMQLRCASERFTVECNRYSNIGDTTKQYVCYNSIDDKLAIITHTSTHRVPDLQQFKRYFVTGLIHNRDSWLEDKICTDMDWILPIHDAGIVTWAGAAAMRKSAVKWMRSMRDNRKEIVETYLTSINLDNLGWKKYFALVAKVDLLRGNDKLTISPYLLK